MSGLPLLLKKAHVLLIGAGTVAQQKHCALIESGLTPDIKAAKICAPYFEGKDVAILQLCSDNLAIADDYDLVVDASGDKELGRLLFERKHCYLLNVVDCPQYCDVYFGAVARCGELSVMVSSGGASPVLAQNVRDKIKRLLPKSLESITQKLRIKREQNGAPKGEHKEHIAQQSQQALGKVFIIGCGPHSRENLTLKALETFALLDIALVDNLIGQEIWDILESLGCETKSVAKQKGKQQFKQAEINKMMLDYAREGKTIARIKGGDPAIFGRVWEEASYLSKHGVEVEVIGGITSALSGALSSGIVPTIRGVSTGVLIVSAHLRECVFNIDWIDSLKDKQYTVIVLMAYSFVGRIVAAAREHGVDEHLPAALVSKVDSPNQCCIIGTLGKLEEMVQQCEQPAILIFGEAIAKSKGIPFVGRRIVVE